MEQGGRFEIDGRTIAVSNLDKVLYPAAGFTKAQVIDYYVRMAPVLLPHLRGRPLSLVRYPDGAGRPGFYAKHLPPGAPEWIKTARIRGRTATVTHVLAEDVATLVWLANLAALELHVPQWHIADEGGRGDPDLLVFDLDPGAPASIVECCEVALIIREILADRDLRAFPKTSGSKGLQLYVPIEPTSDDETAAYAQQLAADLAQSHPKLITDQMAKELRPGKVFIDWSQNRGAKTTISPYSLRAREQPTCSTPLRWSEVEGCESAEDLRFTAPELLERVEKDGDLMEPLLSLRQPFG